MRMWVITQRRKGKTILAASCTNDAIKTTMQRTAYVQNVQALADMHPKVPDNLTTFTQWRPWSGSWQTYTTQLRGANGIPMNYINRKHGIVTPEIEATAWADSDHEYGMTFELAGPEFNVDNKNYYAILKTLLINGPGWTLYASSTLQVMVEGQS